MNQKDIMDRFIVVAFVTILFLPILTFNWEPNKISTEENRYLANFPIIFDLNGNISKTLNDDIEKWFNDNIGLRNEFIKLSGVMEYYIFHRSPSDSVHMGKDGWLFYTGDNNIEIAEGKYPNFDEKVLEEICNQQIKIHEKLKARGIEYVLVLTASKVSIYPEYLFNGGYSIIDTPVDILANYIEKNSNIKVIRIKDALINEKSKSDILLYAKNDTHWNRYGAYIGYCELINKLNEWQIINSEPVNINFFEEESIGDLNMMMKNTSAIYKEKTLMFQ